MSEGILVYGFPVSGNPPTIGGGPIVPPGTWPPGSGSGQPPSVGGGPIIPPPGMWPPTLPPLPGIWPKPGEPTLPITLPPSIWPGLGGPVVMPPIYIPSDPEKPIQLPPGTIWPPLPPDTGISGKVAILVWVVGVGYRWFVYEAPPVAGPK